MFIPNNFVDGVAGATPITAATLNNLETGLVAADITNPASAAGVQAATYALTSGLDAAVAGYVGTSSSTRTALIARELWINAKTYGAVGDGVTDDTAALQSALTAAQNAKAGLFIPQGTYKITSTLTTAQQFYQPNIMGANARGTILAGSGAFSILKMLGGSGSLAVAKIGNIAFTGAGCVGVELSACDGITVDNCYFYTLAGGVLFNNAAAGSFTEFCVAEYCSFDTTVATAIEYRVVSGNNSFHGSGFRNCVINQSASATTPCVLVGAGALVYDAPWDATFFLRATTALIKNNSTSRTYTNGRIGVEGTASAFIYDTASTSAGYHQGDVFQFGEGLKIGWNFILCHRMQVNADLSVTVVMKPQMSQTAAVTGTTTVSGVLAAGDYMVSFEAIGTNYTYAYLLAVHRSAFSNSGTIAQLANGETNNTAAWGAPTFAFSANGEMQITNATAGFSVTAYVGITSTLSMSKLR